MPNFKSPIVCIALLYTSSTLFSEKLLAEPQKHSIKSPALAGQVDKDLLDSIRISIATDTDNGMEQQIVDYISDQLSGNTNVVLSTLNPDWYITCHIDQQLDRMTGQIRYNASVKIKTNDGQLIGAASAQKYNQDFAPQSYKPLNFGTPLNKKLVTDAAQDTVRDVGNRAINQLNQAIPIELKARKQLAEAQALIDNKKYPQAIEILRKVDLNSAHYKDAQKKILQLENKISSKLPRRK